MKKIFLLSILFLSFTYGIAQDQSPEKVLFVGNSYTYFWNLPKVVNLMATAKDTPLNIRHSTSGGVNLGMHWRGERNLKTRSRIATEKYQKVVLQDHSMRTIQHPDSLLYFGKKLSDEIKANGGTPYIYMTWARQWNPLMQEQISKMYRQLAAEEEAVLVPVGEAWALARQLRPDLNLFDADGSHPGPLGTYLTGCLFFSAFTGQSPEGLPARLVEEDVFGEKTYYLIVPPNDAIFLQQVAAKVLKGELVSTRTK